MGENCGVIGPPICFKSSIIVYAISFLKPTNTLIIALKNDSPSVQSGSYIQY
jgi:hypothetical protein